MVKLCEQYKAILGNPRLSYCKNCPGTSGPIFFDGQDWIHEDKAKDKLHKAEPRELTVVDRKAGVNVAERAGKSPARQANRR